MAGVAAQGKLRTHQPLVLAEVATVLAVSLGASALYAVLSLIRRLEAGGLKGQTASLVSSRARNEWLDLAYQLADVATALAPVAVVVMFVLLRGSRPREELGLRTERAGRDVARGSVVAAVIGGTGLALYLAARAVGLAVTVVPSQLSDVWWRIPVLLLDAAQNAVVEEVIVLGWLPGRLRAAGWSTGATVGSCLLLRGSYHLYQGFGAFLGNAAMGLMFMLLAWRWQRITPLLWAHFLIDAVAFVGAVLLAGQVSFLPA
jgi:hypothetical protein